MMKSFVFLSLRRSFNRNLLAIAGFLLAACALILLNATTITTVVQATQIISHNWRSTYDLVVLPPQTHVPVGKAVPADLFEGYSGGISIQQYEEIKHLPGIAVAAPIAFVGYAQYPTSTVLLGSDRPTPGFYRLSWTLTAFNGKQEIKEYQDTSTIYFHNCPSGKFTLGPTYFDAISKLGINDDWCTNLGTYQATAPNAGTFLLAAVDPQEENQLVHLSKSIVSGRMLSEQDTASPDPSMPTIQFNSGDTVPNDDIPVLINTHLPGQIRLHVTFSRLVSSTTDAQQAVALGGASYLSDLPQQTILAEDAPLAQYDPQLLAGGTVLQWNESSWQPSANRGTAMIPLHFSSMPSGLHYRPSKASPSPTQPGYTLIPALEQDPGGTSGGEVAFRNLPPFPSGNYQTYNGAIFNANIVGEFDGTQIEKEFSNALNWLPENTYAAPPLIQRYDAQGYLIKPVALIPTTNPAGFALQPPLALTTIQAAVKIRGQNCISVIRVRVAGNIAPNEAGWQQIAKVAQLIEQRTGLRTLVTLGSSPQPTLVYIPGLKQGQSGAMQPIPPLGWVEERWILIGAGFTYLKQLGQTQTLFLGAILLVCLGYLTVTLSALVSAQRRELAVLSALGWEPWQAAASFLAQAFILALFGAIVGICIALLIVAGIGASPPWLIVAWTIPIILALALLSALYPLWQLWRVEPAEVLRQDSLIVASPKGAARLATWIGQYVPAVLSMAFRNLARSRLRSLIALGSLFLSAGLLTVMIVGLFAFRQSLQGTLLGNFVLLQTAIPQLAGAVVALLLTFLSVADLLLLQVRERQHEIGLLQAVGWEPRIVQSLFVQEGIVLALAATIPGVLLALGILALQHQITGTVPAPLIGLGAIVLMLLVAMLAAWPAIRAMRRLPLSDILRAE